MEIEAKFRVPDEEVLRSLRGATHLAGFPLGPALTEEFADTYLDTEHWQILAGGYFCRRRLSEGHVLITLKRVETARDAVHRREELEVELGGYAPPAEWPDGPARQKVLDLSQGAPLVAMLELRQDRTIRLVGDEEHPVAELSLDVVRLATRDAAAPGGDKVYFEVEAELAEAGSEADLAAIVAELQTTWGLEPEPLSKFQRALEATRMEVAQEGPQASEAVTEEKAAKAAAAARKTAVADAAAGKVAGAGSGKSRSSKAAATAAAGAAVAAADEGQAPAQVAIATQAPEAPADETPAPEAGAAEAPAPEAAVAETQADESPAHETQADETQEAEAPPEAPLEDEPAERIDKGAGKKGKRRRKEVFLGDGLEVLEKPGLTADDTMADAARKTMLYHLQKMMLHEPGTREGDDPEELHDMRVATRRMRAAVRVFEDYLDMAQYKPFLRAMRETGRELGAVRDLDVFMIKTQCYIDSLESEDQSGLDPLVDAWKTERERSRAELLCYLDCGRYERFKEKFEAFLRTPGAGAARATGPDGEPMPARVGDVLPGVVFDRLALVKAYDGPISRPDAPLSTFHQLRITSKGLRYTLEFFQEVLGSGSKPLIDRTKQVQDHLGDLQDAVVTCDVLLGFLGSGTWGPPRASDKKGARTLFPVNAPGVATYLAVKQSEIDRLMHTFGPLWDQIRGSEFSRPLAGLVASL
jgi:CHAD domain-containing protein